MDAINTNVSNDSATPTLADDSDEWGARLNLIYMAIRIWGTTQDVLWNELWATFTLPSPIAGSTAISLGTLTDYRFPGGFLRLTLNGGTQYVPIVKAENAQSYIQNGRKGAYITGNPKDGWTLNLTWTPTSGDGTYGATAVFDYYKFPYKPPGTSPSTEKLEMSDPNFVIFWVSAQKALLESQNNKFSVYDAQATECLDNMRIMNDMLPDYQNNQVENTDGLNGAILGE